MKPYILWLFILDLNTGVETTEVQSFHSADECWATLSNLVQASQSNPYIGIRGTCKKRGSKD